jgi:hypothetical protein
MAQFASSGCWSEKKRLAFWGLWLFLALASPWVRGNNGNNKVRTAHRSSPSSSSAFSSSQIPSLSHLFPVQLLRFCVPFKDCPWLARTISLRASEPPSPSQAKILVSPPFPPACRPSDMPSSPRQYTQSGRAQHPWTGSLSRYTLLHPLIDMGASLDHC